MEKMAVRKRDAGRVAKELRLLVADDHDLIRRGVRSLLERQSGWRIVAEARSAEEAVARTRRLKPDVVVMDISLGESSGLDATREILRSCAGTQVLILTMHESEEMIREIVACGARGYVSKSDAERDLVAAVRALSRHQPFLTPRGTGVILDAYRNAEIIPAARPVSALTGRERQIVRLLAEGRSNKEVASSLGISVKTVETHRTNVMRKLHFSSLSHLVRYAVRSGLVQG